MIIDKKKCINNCSSDDTYKYEYNNKCYSSCPNETFTFRYQNKCVNENEIPENYYVVDSNLSIIDKCDNKCIKCTKESVQNNNSCTSCNIDYFPLYIDILNNKTYFNCYNNSLTLEGYYLDNIFAYKQCYKTCKECKESGNETNYKCTKCLSN